MHNVGEHMPGPLCLSLADDHALPTWGSQRLAHYAPHPPDVISCDSHLLSSCSSHRAVCTLSLPPLHMTLPLLPYPAHVNVTVLQKPAPISLALWNLPRFPDASWMALSTVLCLMFFMPDSHKHLSHCITALFTRPCLLLERDVPNVRDNALFTHQSFWHLLKYLDLRK